MYMVSSTSALYGHKTGAFQHRTAVSFKSVFVPILTCGQESWVMTERVLSQVQTADMRFLRRVHGAALHDKVRSCEIRKAKFYKIRKAKLVATFPPNREISATIVRPCDQNAPAKIGEASSAGYTHGKAVRRPRKD